MHMVVRSNLKAEDASQIVKGMHCRLPKAGKAGSIMWPLSALAAHY